MAVETKSIEFVVATDEESQWLVTLGELWTVHTNTGWQFVTELQNGIDKFSKRRNRTELYELVANQTNIGVKRLMNLVSMSRNENSQIAKDLGLGIAYAEMVLGLDYHEAEALLLQAAEQALSASALGALIREKRQATTAKTNTTTQDLPDAGNERRYISADPDDDSEPPFANKSSILYEQGDDYSAEASAYAGSASGYDWTDDEDDMVLSLNEARDAINRAMQRLSLLDDGTQRTLGEWCSFVLRNAY